MAPEKDAACQLVCYFFQLSFSHLPSVQCPVSNVQGTRRVDRHALESPQGPVTTLHQSKLAAMMAQTHTHTPNPNPNPLPFRFLASSSYVCLVLAFSFCIHFLVGTRFCFIRYRGGGPTHAWTSIGGPTPALYQCLSCHVVSYAGKEKKKKYSDGKAKKYMEEGLENCFRPSVCERIKANSH